MQCPSFVYIMLCFPYLLAVYSCYCANSHTLILMPLGCNLLYLFGRSWLPWICMFRFRTLDRGGAFCGRSSLPCRASWLVSVPVVPDLPFELAGSSFNSWAYCNYIVNRTFAWLWYMMHVICKSMSQSVITLYFVLLMLAHEWTLRFVVLWFLLVLMLSVYTWGYFWPAYVRCSDVPVPVGSGRYTRTKG